MKLSIQEQRDRETARKMLSIGLEAHLRNLITDVRRGNMESVQEFQQMLPYAPPEMRARVQDFLDNPTPKVEE